MLRQIHADVYHSPYYLMPYVLPCPTVVTLYDLIPLRVPGAHPAFFRLVYRGLHHLAAAAACHVLAISGATAADLVRMGLPAHKVTAIPLGVGSEFHPCSPDKISAVRNRYHLPDSFVLHVGTNKPHKNLPRLIKAWALVGRALPLVVAGREDPRYPLARDLARAFGAPVLPIGRVSDEDLPALYSAASLFAFPSLYEGFGLPVLEAMACGTPVVCSNVSSLPEVAGDAALLVDPNAIEPMAEAMRRVLDESDLQEELRARGLAQAATFSWDRTAAETHKVYEQCGREKRR
jgi:alpha-1,3-rhamnosyl/mannosyltransferase